MISMKLRTLLTIASGLASTASLANGPPQPVDPATYGMDPATGRFIHPEAAPSTTYAGPNPVKGSLDHLEQKDYIKNMKILGHWDIIVRPGHTWQHFVDMNGRRYMFHYYRQYVRVYDVTDPANLKTVLDKEYKDGSWFGAASIAFNKKLGKWIMIQTFEVPRSKGGLDDKKYSDPSVINHVLEAPGLRGFRVYELKSPTEWVLLAERSMDVLNPSAVVQQGGGGYDVPNYDGGKYAYMLGAPDNTFTHMEFSNQLYSPAQMIYDMEDPANPRLVSTWWVPGQRLGEEEAYRKWPTAGDQTSWTGGRLPMEVPVSPEKGGRYAYTAMGSLGFYILDIADPAHPKTVSSLQLAKGAGGVEGDHVDASRVTRRGIVLTGGYPMNEDCYEPWKDVSIVDVKDPAHPKVLSVLPRPMPPKDAPYKDFCLRRGKFGPKRASPSYSPGQPDPNIAIYPYFNAGVQVFDISDATKPKNVGYYVPPMGGKFGDLNSYNSPVESIHVEWDRKLIWAFTTAGIYLLSSDALGKPVLTPKGG
jgi:hypothetical protein